MGFYDDRVLPRILDVVLSNRQLASIRQRVASNLSGEVLEVGFGSGLNVPYYPSEVERVLAVDPATVGRKLAEKRVAAGRVPVEYVGLDGESLGLGDEAVDNILVTWTLCTIPDAAGALREMHRVLRPGGRLHFSEHGLSPDPAVARWQNRLNGFQGWWAGGCNLNRPIDRLIEGAGFDVVRLENFYVKGPRAFGHMYEGVATRT